MRTHVTEWAIDPEFFKGSEIHVHVPSGAIPKDGPSAGVTMVTSLVSNPSRRSVRGDVATTGEITLSGRVLPVGGIKEKVLAAKRLGIKEIILPRQNAKNVNEDLNDEFGSGPDDSPRLDDRRGAAAGSAALPRAGSEEGGKRPHQAALQ